jgi:fructose-1,6-bisphosphatase II
METNLPRNLGLELVRATEIAALRAGRWMGLGEPEKADLDATKAMFEVLDSIEIRGDVVIGEEMKFSKDIVVRTHQQIGAGSDLEVDLLLDPIDGRTQLANGFPGVISAAAVAPHGSIWRAPGAIYLEKIIVGADVAPYLVPECMDAPAAWTLALVARVKGVPVKDLTVFALDRPRHKDLINEIRATGAHIMLRPDGDIGGALMVCTPRSGVDLLMGTGGIMEGLLGACAIKAFGGGMFGRLDPQSDEEMELVRSNGTDTYLVLSVDDLVISNQVFFATTGITDGPLLKGVVYHGNLAETDSLILRSETKTRRRIIAEHLLE